MPQEQTVVGQAVDFQASAPISLVNVGRHYDPIVFPHQRNSLDWLQKQLTTPVSLEFAQRWNGTFGRTFPTLRSGDQGQVVGDLQRALNRWGATLTVDGLFGNMTQTAVIRFQRQRNLVADGIVGPKTWAELVKPVQPVQLSQLLRAYEPARFPYQQSALEWLQSKLTTAVLTEFAKRWRNQQV